MSDVTININGGNNQILPNATEAVQNFYGDQFADKILNEQKRDEVSLPEVERLSLYINKEHIVGYIVQIAECQSASELAKVVVQMCEQESRLTQEDIVKERFISLLLPFATKLTKGKGIDNLRARINDAWADRPKTKPFQKWQYPFEKYYSNTLPINT